MLQWPNCIIVICERHLLTLETLSYFLLKNRCRYFGLKFSHQDVEHGTAQIELSFISTCSKVYRALVLLCLLSERIE
jgi:hypothetical protein